MSEQTEAQEKENFKRFFEIILGRVVDIENLNRSLSRFLSDNFYFSDFNKHYDPPLMLSEDEFKALVNYLTDYFDDIGFTGVAERIFMVMLRTTPENKKRLVIVFEIKNINGITIFAIENVSAKTYTNS
jgi:hypothetical protein